MNPIYVGLLIASAVLLYTSSYCINWHIELEERRIDDPCVVKYSDVLLSALIGYIGFPISLVMTIVSAILTII